MRISRRNNPETHAGPGHNRRSTTCSRRRGDEPSAALALPCAATAGRPSHQKETRASGRVESRDDRAGYLPVGPGPLEEFPFLRFHPRFLSLSTPIMQVKNSNASLTIETILSSK